MLDPYQFAIENPVLAGSLLTNAATVVAVILNRVLERSNDRKRHRDAIDNTPAKCQLVSLYAKVVRWEIDQDGVRPLYQADATRIPSHPLEVGVFDETVYTAIAVYDKSTVGHEYLFRGSGVVDLLCLYPWRDKLRYPDQGAAKDPHVVRQVFSDQESNAYTLVTHAYNGLQVGSEDFAVRMPIDSAEGRLVVDLSSVPHVVAAMTEPPKAELRAQGGGENPRPQVFEYRRGIYTIEAKDLEKDDVLYLDFTVDWEQLCQHTKRQNIKSTSSATGPSSNAGHAAAT